MKKLLKSGIFLMAVVLILAPTLVQAFNSAAHIYITQCVFPDCGRKIDLRYGGIAPDFAIFVSEPSKWPNAYDDTHNTDLRPYAWPWSPPQRAFAKGWATHPIADYCLDFHALMTDWIGALSEPLVSEGWDETDAKALAHHAIEKAIDLLLKEEYPELELVEKLRKAVLFRSWEDRFLLVKVFVRKEAKTDWYTLATTELAFRNLTCLYATALKYSSTSDPSLLIELALLLAPKIYEVPDSLSTEDLREIFETALGDAITLCDETYMINGAVKKGYQHVIDDAIEALSP